MMNNQNYSCFLHQDEQIECIFYLFCKYIFIIKNKTSNNYQDANSSHIFIILQKFKLQLRIAKSILTRVKFKKIMIRSIISCSCISTILKSIKQQNNQNVYIVDSPSVKPKRSSQNLPSKEPKLKSKKETKENFQITSQKTSKISSGSQSIKKSKSFNPNNQIKQSEYYYANNSNFRQKYNEIAKSAMQVHENDFQMESDRKFTIQNEDLQQESFQLNKDQFHHEESEYQQNQDFNQNMQPISQSDQNDLQTQKSQLIINDLNIDVSKVQNMFFNPLNLQSKDNEIQQIWQLYEIQQLLYQGQLYYFYRVKNKINSQICQCKSIKKYAELLSLWKLQETNQSREKYNEIYQKQKHYIQCLLTIQKNNCPNFKKIIDYELKPPSIDLSNGKQYNPGSISIIYEFENQSIQSFLSDRNNSLNKMDKKRLIHQTINCFYELFKKGIFIRDFSLKSINIDKFLNLKFFSDRLTKKGFSNECFIQEINTTDVRYFLCPEQIQYLQNQEKKTIIQIDELDEQKICMWKLGVLVFRFIQGNYVFSKNQQNKQKMLENMKQLLKCPASNFKSKNQDDGKIKLWCTQLNGCSFHEIQLIESLLKFDPNERKSFDEILKLPYFNDFMQNSCEVSCGNLSQCQSNNK